MTGPVTAVADLLRSALDLLTDQGATGNCCPLSPQVCRAAVYLGGEVPYDSCDDGCSGKKNGMLWAKLISITPTQGNTDQGACASYIWTAEIGIVRCVAGLGEDGSPPSPARVEADALQQTADADTIFTTLRCCEARSEELKDVSLVRWDPVGQSPCAGGTWTVRGALNVCC